MFINLNQKIKITKNDFMSLQDLFIISEVKSSLVLNLKSTEQNRTEQNRPIQIRSTV
jgi:hypothetical protein